MREGYHGGMILQRRGASASIVKVEGTREGRKGLRSGQIPPPSPALARRQADEEAQRERAARQAAEAADEEHPEGEPPGNFRVPPNYDRAIPRS